jgi:RNA polymerase sigma factor (sigma-70 family)
MGAVLEAATAAARRPVTSCGDHELVRLVRAGDERAFEALFHRYRRRITAYVHGMVGDHGRAEDITQEVFVSALRRMQQTERPIAFRPWIYEIAKNACIDAHRRRSRAEEVSLTGDDGASGEHLRLVSSTPAPDEAVEAKQRLGDLCGAFGGLSDAHHQVLVLRELEGLSYREIGDRMGMSRPAVESTLFRARRRLAQEYEELASGARCVRVQAIISTAAEGALAPRDRRRMARHVAHCQNCRRHARALGVATKAAGGARGARGLSGLLPLPLLPAGEPLALGWGKAAAAMASLAVAGFGAGAVAQHAGVQAPWSGARAASVDSLGGLPSAPARVRPVLPTRVDAPRLPAHGATTATGPRSERAGRSSAADRTAPPHRRRRAARRSGGSDAGGGASGNGSSAGGPSSGASTSTAAAPATSSTSTPASSPSGASSATPGGSSGASSPTAGVPVPSAPSVPAAPSAPAVQVPQQASAPQAPDVDVAADASEVVNAATGATGATGAASGVPSLP